MPGRRIVEAALEIAEHHVGVAKFVRHLCEGYGGVGNVHQVDVAGHDHVDWIHGSPIATVRRTLLDFRTDRIWENRGLSVPNLQAHDPLRTPPKRLIL